MTRENLLKINQLFRSTNTNTALTSSWLKAHGISHKLAWWYVKSGWLEHISHGAYRFAAHKITWVSVVEAIQKQLKLPVYPGGKTALQLLGHDHYISKTMPTIQLFSSKKTLLPQWTKADYWEKTFILHSPKLFNTHHQDWFTTIELEGQSITLSSPEKAALELCHLVQNTTTFSETALIIESLPRMRPKLLQDLLECCQSYKAKRLLLLLAEHFQHGWVSEINVNSIDLGKGKRVIAGGGCYHQKYKTSVPKLKEI